MIAVLIGWSTPAVAATQAELYKYAEKSKKALSKNKKRQSYRHHWLNVIDRYKRVIKKNPDTGYAKKSLLASGDLFLGLSKRSRLNSDLEESLDSYRRLIKRFPKDPLSAKAQLKVGHIYYKQKKDKDRAYVEFLKVDLNHPDRPEAVEARKLMSKISGKPVPKSARARKKTNGKSGKLAIVNGVRHWSTPNYTRVVIDIDRKTKFTDHLLRQDPSLNKPMRLYLDLANSRKNPDAKEELPIANKLLQKVRLAQYDAKTVRVVLDIASIETYRIFALDHPFRIVVDVTGRKGGAKTTAALQKQPSDKTKKPLKDLRETAETRDRVARGKAKKYSDKNSLVKQLSLGVKRVVIDPGHGGRDRGATGRTGLLEKDLTLKVALLLAEKIRSELGLECVLTRTKDKYLPLEERTALANTAGADLFISIHANAHKSPSVHGIETYFLNLATDEEAMKVAARENATTTKHMSDLEVILNDLMLNSKITESSKLAKSVQKKMVSNLRKKYKGIKDMGVKQAPFYVLIGANMPSILVELAFLSNRTDEKRLRSKAYLDRTTDGIISGIKSYTQSLKTAGLK